MMVLRSGTGFIGLVPGRCKKEAVAGDLQMSYWQLKSGRSMGKWRACEGWIGRRGRVLLGGHGGRRTWRLSGGMGRMEMGMKRGKKKRDQVDREAK